MRIRLADAGKSRKGRKRGRGRRGRRRSRTFEATVALPRTASRGSARRARSGKAAGKGHTSAGRSQTKRSRAARRRQVAPPAAAASMGVLRGIRWRSVALRLPALLILVALTGLSVYAATDAKFFVYDAQIVGGRHLEPETIYRAAGVHEQSIFWISPRKVAERVLQLDGIKSVRVRCELPSVVTIEVEEREPIVMWRSMSQQQDLWLDEEGEVLPYHGDVNAPDMVFVVDYSQRYLEVGDRIKPEGMVQSVLQLDAAVSGARVFYYQPARGLSFTQRVDGGEWAVYVGTSEDLPRKIQVVQALTDYLQANSIQPRYVDVRWADHPVYGRPGGETKVVGE